MGKKLAVNDKIIDVRIIEMGMVPAQFFLVPEVVEAVRRAVLADVKKSGKMPPGVTAIHSAKDYTTTEALQNFRGATRHLFKESWPQLLMVYLAFLTVALFVLLWGVL